MASFKQYQQEQENTYNEHVKKVKAELKDFKLNVPIDMYDTHSPLLDCAVKDVVADIEETHNVKGTIKHETDYPDPDGPYGFVRSYIYVTFTSPSCSCTCSKKQKDYNLRSKK